MQASYYDNLPQELRERKQWLLAWKDDAGNFKSPHSVGMNGQLYKCNSNESGWLDFETALVWAQKYECPIGYHISQEDAYCCIDLDVKNKFNLPNNPEKWTTEEQKLRLHKIVEMFDSYAEFSLSGQGSHVWVKGRVGKGRKNAHEGVEIYSQSRFIVCTGRPCPGYLKPIAEKQELLNILYSEIKRLNFDFEPDPHQEPLEILEDDWYISECLLNNQQEAGRLFKYGNGGKYKSESEADLALCKDICRLTSSNVVCWGVFLSSALGKREKLERIDYRRTTLTQARKELEQERFSIEHGKTQASNLFWKNDSITPVVHITLHENEDMVVDIVQKDLDLPPGNAGELCKFFYNSSINPVKEYAVAAVIGWLAGVCGKAWNISGTGLNQYIIVVGRSGTGKESIHNSIENLQKNIADRIIGKDTRQFICHSKFASSPAMFKYIATHPGGSCLNINSEIGNRLRQLTNVSNGRDPTASQMNSDLLALFGKSGNNKAIEGITYSNSEKSFAPIMEGFSFSLMGETTPGTFYDCITPEALSNGLISRFLPFIFEGDIGDRNIPNHNINEELLRILCSLVSTAVDLQQRREVVNVSQTREAEQLFLHFDDEMRNKIRSCGEDESKRSFYTRSHLIALKLASLFAVANNPNFPHIDIEMAQWAINLSVKTSNTLLKRTEDGTIGVGDAALTCKFNKVIKGYFEGKKTFRSDKSGELKKLGMIPRAYLQIMLSKSFEVHPRGSVFALDLAIKNACDNGVLLKIEPTYMQTNHEVAGSWFRLISKL